MADEPEIIAPPEVVDPPAEREQPRSPEELAQDAGEPTEAGYDEDSPDPQFEEEEEFDWNGKKIRGPKGLKDGVLMHGDYTRKTQEVAATRKELEAARARVEQQARASEEEVELRAEHYAKRQQLEQYQNVDWSAWSLQDPIAAQQGRFAYEDLIREVNGLGQHIQERTQQRSAEAQQELAKRIHETREFAKTNIKGYTPELERQVAEFAVEQGVDDATLQANWSPQVFKILHLARLGQQVLSKPAAPKPNPAATAPLQVVAAKSAPPTRKPLSEMSMDEYAAFRTRQEAAKRGARR